MNRIKAEDIDVYKELRKGEWEVTGELRYVIKYLSRENPPTDEIYGRLRRLILRRIYGYVVDRLVECARLIGAYTAPGDARSGA